MNFLSFPLLFSPFPFPLFFSCLPFSLLSTSLSFLLPLLSLSSSLLLLRAPHSFLLFPRILFCLHHLYFDVGTDDNRLLLRLLSIYVPH